MAQHAQEAFTSPKGQLASAHIERPNKKGKLKVIVVVPKAEAKKTMDYIDTFWKENRPRGSKPKPVHKGYMLATDEETGEETGEILFIFSTKPVFPSGDKKIVKVFTAKAPVKEVKLNGKMIARESTGRAIGKLAIYEYDGDYGVTLYLDAISLSTFKEYTGGVDEQDVEVDEEAEDIDLGMETTDANDVEEEEPTEKPRV